MAKILKSTSFWAVLGIIVLLFFLNQWMSREINHSAAPAMQTPAEVASQPTEKVQTPQSLPLPLETQEDASVTDTSVKPRDASPKVGEKVNEPVYEPPTNDVILVE